MTEGEQKKQNTNSDDFGLDAVRELLQLIGESDITEIQIKRGETELHIKRGQAATTTPLLVTPSLAHTAPAPVASPLPAAVSSVAAAASANPVASNEATAVPAGQPVTAPMVGTFYAAPSPKDPPFVNEGDTINIGDRVGIIETMKMMNEIESEVAGRVVRVLVKNGQPVEYGQTLLIVEPI